MNDLYNETIERHGKIYHYDPDRDIYYPRYQEGPISRWAWVFVVGVLAGVCYYLEFVR